MVNGDKGSLQRLLEEVCSICKEPCAVPFDNITYQDLGGFGANHTIRCEVMAAKIAKNKSAK